MGFGYVDGQSVGNASFGHFSAQSLGEEGVGSAPVAAPSANPGPLIIEIDTRNTEAGSSNSDQFGLYLPAGSYNFEVDWGDGNTETITTSGTTTHTYSTEGIYEVTINTNGGTFAGGLNIGNSTSRDRLKYTDIKQWGTYCTYNTCSFYGCSNMTITATDTFVYVSVNGVNDMFRDTIITSSPIMDLSGYTTISSSRWFYNCVNMTTLDASCINPNVGGSAFGICYGCTNLTNFTGDWTNAMSNISNMQTAFFRCRNITTFPTNNFSSCTTFRQAFYECDNLTGFTGGTLDCSAATRIDIMFQDCFSLTSVALTTSASLTNMDTFVYLCSSLTSATVSNTSAVTNFNSAFRGTDMGSFDFATEIDFSAATNMTNMLEGVATDTSVVDDLLVDLDTNNSNTGVTAHLGTGQYTKAPSSAATALANLLARVPAWVITTGGPTP